MFFWIFFFSDLPIWDWLVKQECGLRSGRVATVYLLAPEVWAGTSGPESPS